MCEQFLVVMLWCGCKRLCVASGFLVFGLLFRHTASPPSTAGTNTSVVLFCFIDPRVGKIRNEASSCPGIFSRTLAFTMSLAPLVRVVIRKVVWRTLCVLVFIY